MRLTPVLRSPPIFHYWKDFGAGKKRRIPYYKQWWNCWRGPIANAKIEDRTLSLEQLPPGSRIMDAQDFMTGHIDALPNDILRLKQENIKYDHPWPFNIQLDPVRNQEPMYHYTIETRFFQPRDDCLVLTNTLLETERLKANPPFEASAEHLETIDRQYRWFTKGDSVMVKLPRARVFPKINKKPKMTFGITKERQESNILNYLSDFSQALIAQKLNEETKQMKLEELLTRRSLTLPFCRVPFERSAKKLDLNLTIEAMSIANKPLPLLNPDPQSTRVRPPTDIHPRSWRSLMESNKVYAPSWSFTLPRGSHLHTIHLISRTIRNPDEGEMMARCIVHAFGLANQFARLRVHEACLDRCPGESKQTSVIMQDPLSVAAEIQDKELLNEPIVLQAIGFELSKGHFHFVRYQLNASDIDDLNVHRVKNQAWYSGPISDINEAFRFFLDFQACNSSTEATKLIEEEEDCTDSDSLIKESQQQTV